MTLEELSKRLGNNTQTTQATFTTVANIGTHLAKVEESRAESDKASLTELKKIGSRLGSIYSVASRIEKTIAEALKAKDDNNANSGDNAEERRERKQHNEALLRAIQGMSTKSKVKNVDKSKTTNIKKEANPMLGALAGGLGIAAKGAGLAAGLGALGLGIGAFFTGLAAGDKLQAMLNVDMQSTKKNMVALGEAFAEMPMKGIAVMGVTMALGAKFATAKGALGMGFMGLGIGGFMAGLATGSKGIEMLGTDGEGMKSMMINMAEGLGAFSAQSLVALGALFAAGALLNPVKSVAGITAVGLGVAGFFGALSGVSTLIGEYTDGGEGLKQMLINTAEGMDAFNSVDMKNALLALPAMTSVAGGMAVLFGADLIGKIAGGIASFFGGGEEKGQSIFERLAADMNVLNTIDFDSVEKIDRVSESVVRLADSMDSLGDVDAGSFKEKLSVLAKDIAWALPLLNAMATNGKIGEGYLDGYPEMDFSQMDKIKNSDVFETIEKLTSIGSKPKARTSNSGAQLTQGQKEMEERSSTPAPVIMNAPSNISNVTNPTSISMGGGIFVTDTFDPGTR